MLGEKIGVGGDQMMEHSGTALPTCYWIFYYYGDFSVALSFAKNGKKREQREIEQRESYHKPRSGYSEQGEKSCYFVKC